MSLRSLVAAPLLLAAAAPTSTAGQTILAPAGERTPVVRIVAISDLNGRYGSVGVHERITAAVDRIVQLRPDVVVVTGDMIAGQRPSPRLTAGELRAMWAAFHDEVTDPLAAAGIPVAVTAGNHDGSGESAFAAEREEFERQWRERRPELDYVDAQAYPSHYSFRVGPVLVASVDASTVEGPGSTGLTWLRKTLERREPDGGLAMVFGHLPPFPLARGREREIVRDPQFADLLAREEVDLYLSGHHHAFYAGVWSGVTFVSQAALGSGRRRLVGTDSVSPHAFTVVDVHSDGTFEIRALRAPDFRSSIDLTTLPAALGEAPRRLERLDLARPDGGSRPSRPGSP